jgi:hypothetical protein
MKSQRGWGGWFSSERDGILIEIKDNDLSMGGNEKWSI